MLGVLVDTNLLIDYSHSKNNILEKLLALQTEGKLFLYLNSVVVAEYLTDRNLENKKLVNFSIDFLRLFKVAELGRKEGVLAGKLLRARLSPSLADALVAASCLINEFRLATRNKKHFEGIKNLKFF